MSAPTEVAPTFTLDENGRPVASDDLIEALVGDAVPCGCDCGYCDDDRCCSDLD